MAHQRAAVERYLQAKFFALFHEQGLGKSKTLLDIVANANCNLAVLAPNGLHVNWAKIEVPKHFPGKPLCFYWRGTLNRKTEKEFDNFINTKAETKMFFMNIEAIRAKNGFKLFQAVMEHVPNILLAVDESTCIKNHNTVTFKALMKVARLAARRAILTGTPMSQGPTDLWGQLQFLDKEAIPIRTFTGFKAAFCIEEPRNVPTSNRPIKVITGYHDLNNLSKMLAPFCHRLTKEQCIDLPDKTYQTLLVEMSPEQAEAYRIMKRDALIMLADSAITADTALVLLMRLHQIANGYTKTEEGKEIHYPHQKFKAIHHLLEYGEPIVLFTNFKTMAYEFRDYVNRYFGPDRTVGIYTGDQGNVERELLKERFQKGELDYIVATSAGAMGITLHRACQTVFLSNGFSLQDRLQKEDRIHRIGQTRNCNYIDVITEDTVEIKVLDTIAGKREVSSLVLEDLRKLITDPAS